MNITREVSKQDGRWQAGAVLAICLIGTFLAGQLSPLAQILSRSVFPFRNLVVRESTYHWRAALSPQLATVLGVFQWSLIVAVFASVAWRVRIGILVPLALAVICFVALAAAIVGGMFGVDIDVGFLSDVAPAR